MLRSAKPHLRDPGVWLCRYDLDMTLRPCFGCKTFDDHPRHIVVSTTDGVEAPEEMHMDCCRDLRDCDVCRHQLARVEPATGDALRAQLIELSPLQVDHSSADPFTAYDIREV